MRFSLDVVFTSILSLPKVKSNLALGEECQAFTKVSGYLLCSITKSSPHSPCIFLTGGFTNAEKMVISFSTSTERVLRDGTGCIFWSMSTTMSMNEDCKAHSGERRMIMAYDFSMSPSSEDKRHNWLYSTDKSSRVIFLTCEVVSLTQIKNIG